MGGPVSKFQRSSMFNDPDADITIISSDNVMFRVYRKYLDACTAGFPSSEHIVVDEHPVHLQETSEILEIFFQFIHPCTEATQFHQPSITDIPPERFFALAEAAEKYIAFSVMNLCVTRMRGKMIESHPFETLYHAHKHGYRDLVDEAAGSAISCRTDAMVLRMTDSRLLRKLLLYRSHWENIERTVHEKLCPSIAGEPSICSRLAELLALYKNKAYKDLRQVGQLPPINVNLNCFRNSTCLCTRLSNIQREITLMKEAVPKFSDIQCNQTYCHQ